MKVVILHDAVSADSRPDELDAIDQAELVAEALDALGHDSSTLGVDLDLAALSSRLVASKTELVFNLVESLAGYGRLLHVVPGLLESLQIPFTGSGSSACLLTTNKPLAKSWMHQWDIPTPRWRCAGAQTPYDIDPPCRCIIKPTWEDASVGIDDNAVVQAASTREIDVAIQHAGLRLGDVFAEQFVEGREFNLSLLARDSDVLALPIAEIEFVDYPAAKPKIVGYEAKWDKHTFEYGATQRRFDFDRTDESLIARMREVAVQCWRRFDLRGYARVDFRVDEQGQPWVLEVNANPCLAADAGFMAAAQRSNLSPRDVIRRVVAAALMPQPTKDLATHA